MKLMKGLFIKLQGLLDRYSSGRNILYFFIITQLVYGLMLFFSIPKVMQYSNGMKILDLLPAGYNVQYAQKLFETLGNTGREIYLFQQLPVDMIYPLLFAITYSLLLTYLLKTIFPRENKIHYLGTLPIFGGIFDYLENTGIIIMLSIYPNFKPEIVIVSNIFTVLKSLVTTIVFILLITMVIILAIRKIQNKKNSYK